MRRILYECENTGEIIETKDSGHAQFMVNICRWHGCDEEGTLFLEDFNKLNENGLFDHWQDAYDYLVKYLSEDWTERGTFGIYEVYRK